MSELCTGSPLCAICLYCDKQGFSVHRKPKGKGPFWRHWHKEGDNSKMNHKDRMRGCGLQSSGSGEIPLVGFLERNSEPLDSEFLEQLFNMDCAAWIVCHVFSAYRANLP